MNDTLLVVIDAQRAFVDPDGSLTRAFGVDDVLPCVRALARLRAHVARRDRRFRTVFVRSEYEVAQFTGGRFDHPLAHLCVPGRNIDCECFNPTIRAIHTRLHAAGKPSMVIIGAAMRKLIHLAYGVLKSGRAYEPTCAHP